MFKNKYKIIVIALIGLFIFSSPTNSTNKDKNNPMKKLDCLKCHTCKNPTSERLCLKPFPTIVMPTANAPHTLAEAPDSFVIGQLSDLYQPVHFNHKLHANMAQMGNNCQTCHHYSPPGRIPPCSECHGGANNPQTLRRPSLKGAYHRLCLSCHREWSHETKCVICHLPTPGKIMASTINDTTDIIGISHPKITVPDTKIFITNYKKAPIVTFHHKEHIELIGLKCADCHKKESCDDCHDLKKPVKIKKTQEEVHAICNDCHRNDKCEKYHGNKEKPAFSHASTGWPLNRFHQKLSCLACHPTGKKITKLDTKCNTCHGGWNQENFNHAVTGLILNETHREFDCDNCHIDRAFDKPPDCSNCHDDGRTYKTKPPGKFVKYPK